MHRQDIRTTLLVNLLSGKDTTMKRFFLALLLAATFSVATPSHAQIPVTDVAVLQQQISQVLSWARQFQQMVEQLDQLRETYNSMTGARGLGEFLNGIEDQEARRYLPDDLAQIYDLFNNTIVPGFGALNSRITALRSIISTLPPGYFPAGSEMDMALTKALDGIGAQRAMAEVAYKNTTDRIPTIEALMDRINSTNDPKEIAELQARINAEQALIQNEANRIAVLQYQQKIADQEQQQRSREQFSAAQQGEIPTGPFPTTPY